MTRTLLGALWLVCGLCSLGCGDDDDDSSSGGSGNMAGTSSTAGTNGSGGSNGSGQVSERCREGCMLVVEAACPISPDSQESCESDCQENETGDCATEYDAFQDCAEGKGITCTSFGIPGVEGCETEQNAFIACLSSG